MFDNINYSSGSGHYLPSYFKISVIDDSYLFEIDTPGKTQSLFLHEYFHFIQDITTIYGLNNLARVSELNQHYIKHWKEQGIDTPIYLTEDVRNNINISSHLNGSTGSISLDFNIIDIQISINNVNAKERYDLPLITLITSDSQEFKFGAHPIMEGMAYIFEKIIGEENLKTPPFYPYRLIYKVWEYYFPETEIDEITLFILCDLALMHSEPSNCFIKNLERLKDQKINLNDHDLIYRTLYPEQFNLTGYEEILKILYPQKNEIDINKLDRYQLLNILSQLASIYIRGYFPAKSEFDIIPEHEFIKYQLTVSLKCRLENPYFLLDIIKGGKLSANLKLKEFISFMGSPITIDKEGKAHYIKPSNFNLDDVSLEHFWALRSFLYSVTNNFNSGCHLQMFCQNSDHNNETDLYDSDCLENIKERLKTIKMQHCPLQKTLQELKIKID
ncbi:hypothetical protein ACP6L2_03930 [Sphingobacterium lactis]|uniref:hypothetical protein n=1 Tax=Sphingobacterium lactis TaxID=797291 RepID=UPI003F7D1901